jgi:hypothetical protein
MSPTELKMQPTPHFRKKLAIEIKISSFVRKCIVGCIFNSVGLIITRLIPCINICMFLFFYERYLKDKIRSYVVSSLC